MRRRTRLELSRLSWIALAVLLAVSAVFLLRQTVGTTFWVDEWDWALNRRGNDIGTFLRPHNEHLSLVPIALYKLLFATAGLDQYAPYRVMVTVAHMTVVVLLFIYARRRVGEIPALLAAALILLLGPAWQNILWPFQVGTLISLAAGVGVLLALDRGDGRGDVTACALLTLALASSGLGLPVAIGVAVEVLWRRRPGSLWIVGVPAVLYGIWWLAYQDTEPIRNNLALTPGYAADSAASALSALTGLVGDPINRAGTALGWGRPLLVAAVAGLAWRLRRIAPVPPRVVALLAMALSFWILTGLRRAQISTPYESRYLYVSGLFLVLVAVELVRGVPFSRRALTVATVLVAAIVVANVGDMRDGGSYLRSQAPPARAALAAVEITRPAVSPDTVLGGFPGFPFVVIRAGPYFAAAADLGSPAMSTAELATTSEGPQRTADAQMAAILDVHLQPGAPAARGSAPAVDRVAGGTTRSGGACVTFRPADARTPDVVPALDVTVPPDGLRLTARGGAATVSVRRFADGFPSRPRATLAGSATLRIGRDLTSTPWHARIAPEGELQACGLASG